MMKTIKLALIFALPISVHANEKFGGIYLDSSIPSEHVQLLKSDFTYLYNNKSELVDSEFQSMAELSKVDGAHMYNWIFNRAKFIVGEDYSFTGRNLVKKKGHIFPATPVPPSVANRMQSYAGTIIMSNSGAELYLTGKLEKTLKGIRLDRNDVFATSPRVGILQIGEGLFAERFLINKDKESEANKIKRIGTIFHEARHSDGHSEHIGFIHSDCPPGHLLSGLPACENYANGSYSLEAVALKNLLLNCNTCSIEDSTKLTASIADALGRVTLRSHVKTEAQLLEEMKTYKTVIDFYEDFIAKNPKVGAAYVSELERVKAKYKECDDQLKELKTPVVAKKMDAKPEGTFIEVSVEESSKLMKSSLTK